MRFDFEHFRTKIGRRIVMLFVLCAVVPTAALSVVSYLRARSVLRDQTTAMMELGTTNAQMGALERLQSIESELILLATSPGVDRALTGAGGASGGASIGTESLRRLSALTLATSDATIPIHGDLTDTPELPSETLANLDRGQSALAVIRGAGNRPEILIARAPGEEGTDAGILWGRIIADSLWATAQVYAVDVAASEIDLQDDSGYCVLDATRQPLDCAGALVAWFSGGVPQGIEIPEGTVHGALSWATDATSYAGHYRRLFLTGFNSDDWTIVLARDEQSILQELSEFQGQLLGFLVLTFAVVLLISAGRIRRSMEPLAKLREGTRRVAAQDFNARVLISSGDEFEELAGSFNNMAEQVGTLFQELRDLNWSTITTPGPHHRREISLDGRPLGARVPDVRGDRTHYGVGRGRDRAVVPRWTPPRHR